MAWKAFGRESAGAWMAVATVILCVFTGLLWRVSESANRTAIAAQRASLSFAGLSGGPGVIDQSTQKRTGQSILVDWVNTGNTPTRSAVGVANFQLWSSDLPQHFDFHDVLSGEPNKIALGPHERGGIRLNLEMTPFRQQREGRGRLFFWGWVAYRDIFDSDVPHLTEFCAEMTHVAVTAGKDVDDPTTPISWDAVKCAVHNCYDENCSDYSERVKQIPKT